MSNREVTDRTEPRICIYCKMERRFQRGKRGGEFNSEHVMPQAFASVRNSLTLIGKVCTDCNGLLGRTIDQNLSRGTIEAIDRFKEKQKPAERIGELSRKKLNITLEKSENESIRKAHVELTHDGTEIKQQFSVQLIIRLKGSEEWLAIPRSEFASFAAETPNVDLSEFKILGDPPQAKEFFEEIEAVWPGIKLTGELEPSDHVPEVVVDYGPDEQRALAKIAFN